MIDGLTIGSMHLGAAIVFILPISTDFLSVPTPPPPLLAAAEACTLGSALAIEALTRDHRRQLAHD